MVVTYTHPGLTPIRLAILIDSLLSIGVMSRMISRRVVAPVTLWSAPA
jgi:hypothetical protein